MVAIIYLINLIDIKCHEFSLLKAPNFTYNKLIIMKNNHFYDKL